ncbi:hypothetical protein KMW28_13555 [Flammeovirga yaeyamensis]|uniref:Uncharacterized protein n=1 Tax=Flammeovirga yaeyamensis TaxID=367791 RepID=A0AAX1N014_9BACT|nr:hypothetical protein [Flammeovirga yaeyamensis]MBB3700920.1 hypothetical protein [Flammeovirga yaeyamensis]NMF38027.1 hypothetical protein [Flammeovirga yaeyamensis]QWG00677.1 hypothetical protein KMW28_13555 [Flammeovirga yaeyamensis]
MAIFKRWSRTGYAIFNSLKREIKIAVLNVSMHLNAPVLKVETSSVQQLFDQDDDDDDLKEVDLLLLTEANHSLSDVSSSSLPQIIDFDKDTHCFTFYDLLNKLFRIPPNLSEIYNGILYRVESLCPIHKSIQNYYAD